ncbi:3',5'-cyclic-AMP phosphodiesterase [Conservatibacter flavescens]|uniref:3',5'-cyclic adenosine monophosphate phosphodiesterase CpdA n=1 Tax=Conservatibacter flavescens TaxID=28161 RepID=A0A2M8S214_9PAST|nr:3',5'-cyclic-AMP phosphodiesterase [Conservatibacter flavescens]PJG85183.1 3',5'-cyclic-AMP phosphodiesterase [Conservatibacter flavescens]
MLSSFSLNTADSVVRFLQITDPHLFKEENSDLLGINTLESFKQVLTEILQQDFPYEFVLATGDIVQDSSDEAYQRFVQLVQCLEKTVFWIPGNHDFQPKMFDYLTGQYGNINPNKHILAGEHWQILMLDSQVFGVPHGQLSQYQLDWLVAKLKEYPNRYSLVVLHHHILPTHSSWLDQHNLRNLHDLMEALSPFEKVKGILHGHIHQQVDDYWHGYKVMSTPSTCIQFKPDCHQFTLDNLQPGWREIELHADGNIYTQVKRIQQKTFLPNFKEEGY